jgi:cyanophycin synthetase
MSSDSAVCVPCGFAPQPHLSLWISSLGDVLALPSSPHKKTKKGLFEHLADAVGHTIAHLLVAAGSLVGAVKFSDDITGARNDRSKVIWEEARRRGIPVRQLVIFGTPTESYEARVHGKKILYESVPIPSRFMSTATHIDDKVQFKALMRAHDLPVPASHAAMTYQRAEKILDELGLVCVKPRTGSNGRHTYPYITTKEDLAAAFRSATEICPAVSIEEHLEGDVCRATCVDGQFVGFLESKYPTAVGDGVSTIRELVATMNAEKQEGVADIELTDYHAGYMRRRGYTPDSILPEGVSLPLLYRAGASSGGSNREYGRNIHPSFIPYIEKAARATGLALVGFDLIIPDAHAPADSQKWGFIEANTLPWIDLHHEPFSGEPVNVAGYIWDLWE